MKVMSMYVSIFLYFYINRICLGDGDGDGYIT